MLDAYSGMEEREQRKFDKRYADLMKFRRQMKTVTKLIAGGATMGTVLAKLNIKERN
jgi:hypothetical protein